MIAVIELLLLAYIGGCIIYNLFFSLAGRLAGSKTSAAPPDGPFARIAILVPAYREDEIILSTVRNYETLAYPRGYFDIVVIADHFRPETLAALRDTTARVIDVAFDVSTKARALNTAFNTLPSEVYDIALICDADNLLAPDFLRHINHAWQRGYPMVQAQRVAKNIDTPFAILDTANEIIANHIYRKGANVAGFSASLIGSGMAFSYPLIRSVLREISATGGFDKVLQMKLTALRHGNMPPIHYLPAALVYDEKVDNPAAFRNQRRRWLVSQFQYLSRYWTAGWKALFRGNIDFFNLAVCQNLLLPRMILLAAVTVMAICSWWLQPWSWVSYWCWWGLWAGNALSLLLPLPRLFYTRYFFTALCSLPQAIVIMVALLFRLKGANRSFIHTPHSRTTIHNPLFDASRK